MLLLTVTAGCSTLLGEDFRGYSSATCTPVGAAACGGLVDAVGGRFGGDLSGGLPGDAGGTSGATGVAGALPAATGNDAGAGGEPTSPSGGGADASGAAGQSDRTEVTGGDCSIAGYPTTPAIAVGYGVGHFTGHTEGAGVFRSMLGLSTNDGFNGPSGWVDVLTSNGTSFDLKRWWGDHFYGSYGTLAGDLDADGSADLVSFGVNYIGVVKATSCGSFGAYQQWWAQTFAGPYGDFLGDIDGDKRADAVGVGPGYVGMLRSTGTGFGPYEQSLIPTFLGKYGNFLADVDGDGKSDLVGLGDDSIEVCRSVGKACAAGQTCPGNSFPRYQQWAGVTFNGTRGNAMGDVNGDGFADIVAFGDGQVRVALSNGVDSFSYQEWSSDTVVGTSPVMLADVNNDGKADITLSTGNTVTVHLSTPVGLGVPGTRFGAPQTWYTGAF